MNNNEQTIKYPNALKEHRLRFKLKQKEVATFLGFKSEDRICRWEKGTALPSIPNLFKLAKFYDVTAEKLYPTHISH